MSAEINSKFICSITREVMLTPVAAQPCGHIFERAAIEQWMRQQGRVREQHLLHEHPGATCPWDQREISLLAPQDGLREEIRAFITANPALFDDQTSSQLEEALLRESSAVERALEQTPQDKIYAFLGTLPHPNRLLKQREKEQLLAVLTPVEWHVEAHMLHFLETAKEIYLSIRRAPGEMLPGIGLEFSGPSIDRAYAEFVREFGSVFKEPRKHAIMRMQHNYTEIGFMPFSFTEKVLKILRAPLIAGAVIAVSAAVMTMSLLSTSKQSESGA